MTIEEMGTFSKMVFETIHISLKFFLKIIRKIVINLHTLYLFV